MGVRENEALFFFQFNFVSPLKVSSSKSRDSSSSCVTSFSLAGFIGLRAMNPGRLQIIYQSYLTTIKYSRF